MAHEAFLQHGRWEFPEQERIEQREMDTALEVLVVGGASGGQRGEGEETKHAATVGSRRLELCMRLDALADFFRHEPEFRKNQVFASA